MSEKHTAGVGRKRSEQTVLAEKTQLPILLTKLMSEHSATLAEVVGEYEGCAVALEQAFDQLLRASAQRQRSIEELRQVAEHVRTGRRREATKLLNSVMLGLKGPE